MNTPKIKKISKLVTMALLLGIAFTFVSTNVFAGHGKENVGCSIQSETANLLENDKDVLNAKFLLFCNLLVISEDQMKQMIDLIDQGADVNVKTNKGESILTWAIRREYISFANLLIQKGAKVNMQNSKKETPLMIACFNYEKDNSREEYKELIINILKKGAKTTLKNSEGKTVYDMISNSEIKNIIDENKNDGCCVIC